MPTNSDFVRLLEGFGIPHRGLKIHAAKAINDSVVQLRDVANLIAWWLMFEVQASLR